jgi:AcrR family transcriptional regulator
MNVHLASFQAYSMDRRAERTAETRSRIERAALKHFVEKGIAETSIRDIADEARVSLGAMYNHFASKEDLAWHLFIGGWNDIGDEMRRRARGQSRLPAKMRAMVEHVFRRFDEDWLLVTYVFRSRHQYLMRMPATRGNPYAIFRLVIADAMRHGEIPQGDLELKTSLIVGAIIQVVDSRILSRLKTPLTELAATTSDCCVRMLTA